MYSKPNRIQSMHQCRSLSLSNVHTPLLHPPIRLITYLSNEVPWYIGDDVYHEGVAGVIIRGM